MSDAGARSAVPAALLAGEDLPSLPAVAVEVLNLCRREEVTLDDLAAVVAVDPALAAKLLRYSNSSLFNLGSQVTTLPRAMLVLGLKSVQLMSLSFSLADSLPRAGPGFDYDTFWRRSLALAVAGRLFAELTGGASEDEAFLCGLLGEIGRLVLARASDGYGEQFADQVGWPERKRELEVLGYHSGEVGGLLLEKWGLSATICLSVSALHDPTELIAHVPAERRRMVDVLHGAHLAVEVLCEGSSGALEALLAHAAGRFQLASGHVEGYLLALEGAFGEAALLLDLPPPTQRSHAAILDEARAALVDLGKGGLFPAGALAHRAALQSAAGELDALTGLVTAAGFHEYVKSEVRARRTAALPHAFGVLLVELDGFATAGGAAEEVQRLVASILRRTTRRGDLSALLEPGCFGVLVPECTAFGLRTLAERIRIGVMQQTLDAGGAAGARAVTVSIGGGCLGRAGRPTDGDALLDVSRRYLARARTAGGNASLVHPAVIHGPSAAA